MDESAGQRGFTGDCYGLEMPWTARSDNFLRRQSRNGEYRSCRHRRRNRFRVPLSGWRLECAADRAEFPWGTFTVNVVGSFLIGLLVELVARRLNASMEMRLFLVTGVLGGFTTFSSFSLDAVALFERGALGLSAVYIIASLVVSIAAVFAGLALGRSLF